MHHSDNEDLSTPPRQQDVDPEMEMAVQEALGEDLPAAELRRMRDILHRRRAMLTGALQDAPDAAARRRVESELGELDENIAALHEEAGINQFVEETARFSVQMQRMNEG